MIILEKPITRAELSTLAENFYGDMIKGVVDVEQELLALDAELHSDLEGMLLREGSSQEALWGINLYPEVEDDDFLEFDSLINIRPRQGNRSRDVENKEIREKIESLRKELSYHAKKYYDEDKPEISDFEYDMMMNELKSLEKQFPE